MNELYRVVLTGPQLEELSDAALLTLLRRETSGNQRATLRRALNALADGRRTTARVESALRGLGG